MMDRRMAWAEPTYRARTQGRAGQLIQVQLSLHLSLQKPHPRQSCIALRSIPVARGQQLVEETESCLRANRDPSTVVASGRLWPRSFTTGVCEQVYKKVLGSLVSLILIGPCGQV